MAHASARLTPLGRALLVDRIRSGWTITAASAAAGISRQTGSKWWHRRDAGPLVDRPSAVRRQARRVPEAMAALVRERRLARRVGPHVLAWETGMARSTVYAILRRCGDRRASRGPDRASAVIWGFWGQAAPGNDDHQHCQKGEEEHPGLCRLHRFRLHTPHAWRSRFLPTWLAGTNLYLDVHGAILYY